MGYDSIAEVLKGARVALSYVSLGVGDFQKGTTTPQREAGLRNAVIFGRTVTFALQNIRTFDRDHFNTWYEPKQEAMKANPRFEYLKELRNQLEKEGRPAQLGGHVHIHSFRLSQINELQRPPGAGSFFMGDQIGGSGWDVAMPDGTAEKFYIELPPSFDVDVSSHFTGAAGLKGVAPPKESTEVVLREYVDYLLALVSEAETEFGHI